MTYVMREIGYGNFVEDSTTIKMEDVGDEWYNPSRVNHHSRVDDYNAISRDTNTVSR